MSYVKVELVCFERVRVPKLTNTYEFRADKKHHWLQRLCFFVLRKIGAYQIETVDTLRLSVNPDEILKRVMTQITMAHIMGVEPVRVFIGAKNWPEIRNRPDVWSYVTLPPMTALVGYSRKQKLLGLDVTIVPWMDGALVLPAEGDR